MSGNPIRVRLQQSRPIPLDVELESAGGEIHVVVGPSGSGKTTILRSIAGLYHPVSGHIACGGSVWFDSATGASLPVQSRSVGMVFQHYALFPHLTALGNIMLALPRDTARRRDAAAELLALVNMEGLEARFPDQLSGGQQQRVALARALARDPGVLLLDEPFSSVDRQTRNKLMRELVRLRRGLRMPVMLVTHDLDEARMLADRISVIHHGRTLQTAAPQIIMSRPASAEVARLVGLENVFSATVHSHDESKRITYIDWLDYRLECMLDTAFPPGERVDWVIPAESVILHRRDRPSRGERENPVRGHISELIELGEITALVMQLPGDTQSLSLSVPTHVARRNYVAEGAAVGVSLIADAIHLMHPVSTHED